MDFAGKKCATIWCIYRGDLAKQSKNSLGLVVVKETKAPISPIFTLLSDWKRTTKKVQYAYNSKRTTASIICSTFCVWWPSATSLIWWLRWSSLAAFRYWWQWRRFSSPRSTTATAIAIHRSLANPVQNFMIIVVSKRMKEFLNKMNK